MFYHLLYPLSQVFTPFNLFRYITFRAFLAFIIATVVSILWGKRFIRLMKLRQFGQIVRDDGPQSHKKKQGTPTFGGIFIVGSIFIALILCGNFHSIPLLSALFVGLSYFILGWLDDYLKVLKKNSKGISARVKLIWQFVTSLIVMSVLVKFKVIDTAVYTPFMKEALFDLGTIGYIIFGSFVIVGSSNAVNLTDGLDGLATGSIITSAATLAILSYIAGHIELSTYLLVPHVETSGELSILAAAVVGASVGFLWYNAYPAEIFMGDVGSLSLGGILGAIALITKNEILFLVIGGIFVMEAVSVILQVASFKMRGKRIFKMAPIHHHFELLGWSEPKVIVRFWIISIFLAIVSIATLKLR